jgi:hypothetical protein
MEITMTSYVASNDAIGRTHVRTAAATSIRTRRLADTCEPIGGYRLAPVFVRSTGDVCPLTGVNGAADTTVTNVPGSQSWGPPA